MKNKDIKSGDLYYYRDIPVIIINVYNEVKKLKIKNIEKNTFEIIESKTCECLFPMGVDTVTEYFLNK